MRAINNVKLRFVTNTTKESKATLLKRLHRIGFEFITADDMFTSLSAAVQYVNSNQLRPFYLLTEDAKSDFITADESHENKNAIVVGLAPDKFDYETMNTAFRWVSLHFDDEFRNSIFLNFYFFFRILMKENSQLVAVHEGKYYKRADGLAIGPGCFTRGLEYVTGKKATVIGKPNPYFFNSAIPNGLSPSECCMIGDVSKKNVLPFEKIEIKKNCIIICDNMNHL